MSRINYWKIMTRRKCMPAQECMDSQFGRVFGTFDLTALGVSATLGVGVYVLAGHVAKVEAGPSVILSFAIAAAASLLAGLCYAEFASRVPKSGSAYVFTYVAIGEFIAFIIGWNLLLEYIIGSASISKGLSLYIDSLINNTMKNSFTEIAPLNTMGGFISSYFDFFAFSGPLLLGLALAFGLRKSAGMNNILCILNLGVVLYVVIVVLINANIEYWRIDPNLVDPQFRNITGSGGFFPFGFSGTLRGAATCFFGFVGFDCIATTGEEVRNPQKAVPRAILFSLVIIFFAYFGVSLLTLMWPYYLLDAEAPLPHVFEEIGWIYGKWTVTIGGIIGLIASLFGAMFPLPRILYAMSSDGLIFREFGIISDRFKTPVVGTLCAAMLTSCFAAFFDLAALVNMLSIGVLLAYTVVAISIIILRFSEANNAVALNNNEPYIETSNLLRPGYNVTVKGFFLQLIRFNSTRQPNTISMTVVGSLIAFYCVVSLALALQISYGLDAITAGETWAVVLLAVFVILLLVSCLLISIQPRQKFRSTIKPFSVPFVPLVPAFSVFVNIYLMLMLDHYTWIRFGIWMILGLMVYFPCAWYFNRMPSTTSKQNKNESSIATIETNFMEKASKSMSENNVGMSHKNNEGVSIEEENVIVVHENHNRNIYVTSAINDKISEDNETHLAIGILDTVLENEENDSSDSEELEKSMQSIKASSEERLPNISMVHPHDFTETLSRERKSAENLKIIDPEVIRSEIRSEIDEILERARDIVGERDENNYDLKNNKNDENVFQNKKFLTHLSDLISNQSSMSALQSQTLQRTKKNDSENKSLKHSNSAPDLKDVEEKTKNDENLKSDDVIKVSPIIPPIQPRYNNELLQKFAAMKERESAKEQEDQKNEDTISSEGSVDKGDFREKLEQLLSKPPDRLSALRPVPLPRTSIISKTDFDTEEAISRNVPPVTPVTPASATLMRQKAIFDEVLRKIKKSDDDENS